MNSFFGFLIGYAIGTTQSLFGSFLYDQFKDWWFSEKKVYLNTKTTCPKIIALRPIPHGDVSSIIYDFHNITDDDLADYIYWHVRKQYNKGDVTSVRCITNNIFKEASGINLFGQGKRTVEKYKDFISCCDSRILSILSSDPNISINKETKNITCTQ